MKGWAPKAAVLAALLLANCAWVQDRFRCCGHMAIALLNSELSIGPVEILAEDERESADLLLASGASRRLSLCVERGDSKRFRALRAGETVAVSNCVVTRSRDEFESTVARVVWDARGLVCENW